MNCEDMTAFINLEIDGMLPEAEREAFARHLRLCPVCAERKRQLTETAQLLTNLDKVSLPRGFAQAVMASIPSVSRAPAFYHLKGALASALIGILGLLLLLLPLAGYGTSMSVYDVPQAEVEADTELLQVSSPIDNATTQTVDFFDSLLDAVASVRFEFIAGTCLILASVALAFSYLMNEAIDRPLPSAALVGMRRVRHNG